MERQSQNSPLWRRAAVLLATGFGLGLSPVAPGTMGSLLGIPLAAAVLPLLYVPYGWVWQSLIAAVLCVVAIPICDRAERAFGTKDDHRIVADEYLTFPLCLIGIPWHEHLSLLAVAFVVSRVNDIIKPPPARQLQCLKGGLGIVIDDVFASLYTLAVMHAAWWALVSM